MHSMVDIFEASFNRLLQLLASLVAVSIGLVTLLIPLNLFLLKFKLGSFSWLFSSVEYGLYFGVFAAAPWVLQQGAHVRVDLLSTNLTAVGAAHLNKFTNIFGAVVCMALVFYGSRSTLIEFIEQTMPDRDLQIANWIIILVFTVSFTLSAIEFLMRLRENRVLEIASVDKSAEVSF